MSKPLYFIRFGRAFLLPLPFFLGFLAATSCVTTEPQISGAASGGPESKSVGGQKTSKIGRILVLYTSNRQGEMEPCGCQVNQLGGMDRMQNALTKERVKGNNLFVDGGDSFFPAPQLRNGREELEKERAEFIAKAYAEMSLDVFTPGERDFAAGLEELNKLRSLSRARFVVSNLTDSKGEPLFETEVILERAGIRIGILGVASEDAFQNVTSHLPGLKISDPFESVRKGIEGLRGKKIDVILVLSHLGLKKDRELARVDGVDLIVGSHSLDVLVQPEKVGKASIVQPMFQGQQLGSLLWDVGPRQVLAHSLIDLGDTLTEPNTVTPLLEAFKKEKIRWGADGGKGEGLTHRAELSAHPFVAHPYTCRGCHQPQYEFWAKTKHASAYLVLYSKKQHFDPECVGCHTLGFGEPGGFEKISEPAILSAKAGKVKGKFIDGWMKFIFGEELRKGALDSRVQPARFKKLQQRYLTEYTGLEKKGFLSKWYVGVQCEHCHGNRDGHPGRAITQKKVDENSCRGCHTPPNAKLFDPRTIPRVACPLMKH